MIHKLRIVAAVGLLVCAAATRAQPGSPLQKLLDENEEAVCEHHPSLPKASCVALVEAAAKSAAGVGVDEEKLKATLTKDFKQPEYLNSALARLFGGHVPWGLEFKTLDSKTAGESVLGLGYDIEYQFSESKIDAAGKWRKQGAFAFQATGTIVNDGDKNPRNFSQTKLSASRSYTTNIPQQTEAFADRLTAVSVKSAQSCAGAGAATTEACKQAKAEAYGLLDSTSAFLRSFQRYKVGVDAGYESDQNRNAVQSTLGVFAFGQYEDWGGNSWAGGLQLTPSFRVAVDSVNPNSDTPRAMAGDDSTYYRFSGEVSLWIPVGNFFNQHEVFTFNYRYYSELSPSDIVKNAKLDAYNLRTFGLTSPTGLFVSYSSGRLPFELQSDHVVELGWKTYF